MSRKPSFPRWGSTGSGDKNLNAGSEEGDDEDAERKDTFNDFGDDDDSDMHNPEPDDDDDDDDVPQHERAAPVDLDKFMNPDADKPEEEPVKEPVKKVVKERSDFDDDDDDDLEDEEEEDEEEEDEAAYETQEDDFATFQEVVKTQSQLREEARLEALQQRRAAKEKKRTLIHEYLQDAKRLEMLRLRNAILSTKIVKTMEQKQAICEKYLQLHQDELERQQESERLRKLNILQSCESKQVEIIKNAKKSKDQESRSSGEEESDATEEKVSEESKAPTKEIRFADNDEAATPSISAEPVEEEDTQSIPSMAEEKPVDGKIGIDIFLETMEKRYPCKQEVEKLDPRPSEQPLTIESVRTVSTHESLCHPSDPQCGFGKRPKRLTKPQSEFSFGRSQFLHDVVLESKLHVTNVRKKKTGLMKISLAQFGMVKNRESEGGGISWLVQRPSVGQRIAKRSMRTSRALHITGGLYKRKKSDDPKQSRVFSKSKVKVGLVQTKQDQQEQFQVGEVDLNQLGHFTFQYMPVSHQHSRQLSGKLRSDMIKLLQARNIPTSHLKWPLELKGAEQGSKNPYGRVIFNYTNPSHHEKEQPHVAYRFALDNLAFFRVKQQRLTHLSKKNQLYMEEERQRLAAGIEQILHEIIEGIKLWRSFCGESAMEKKQVKQDTDKFIEDVYLGYDKLLVTLIQLYKQIHSSGFALRRLSISEAKGEGAELHDFKDIMRTREKLRAEHKNVERLIEHYQRHSLQVLKIVKRTDKRVRETEDIVEEVKADLDHLTKVLIAIIDGMYYCQRIAQRKKTSLSYLRGDLGILDLPGLVRDFENVEHQIGNMKIKRVQIIQQNDRIIREMLKMERIR